MNCKNYENGKCMVKYYVQETSPYHECDEVMLSADFEPDGKPVMFYEESMGHRTKRFFQWSGKMGERF